MGVERKEVASRRGFLYFSDSAFAPPWPMVALFGTMTPGSNRAHRVGWLSQLASFVGIIYLTHRSVFVR